LGVCMVREGLGFSPPPLLGPPGALLPVPRQARLRPKAGAGAPPALTQTHWLDVFERGSGGRGGGWIEVARDSEL
jgi:hypothetical protein